MATDHTSTNADELDPTDLPPGYYSGDLLDETPVTLEHVDYVVAPFVPAAEAEDGVAHIDDDLIDRLDAHDVGLLTDTAYGSFEMDLRATPADIPEEEDWEPGGILTQLNVTGLRLDNVVVDLRDGNYQLTVVGIREMPADA